MKDLVSEYSKSLRKVTASFIVDAFEMSQNLRAIKLKEFASSDNRSYKFSNLLIEEPVLITRMELGPFFVFENCRFTNHLTFKVTSNTIYLHFKSCEFDAVEFTKGTFKQAIYFTKCKGRYFGASGSSFSQLDIDVSNCSMFISSGTFTNLLIHGSSDNPSELTRLNLSLGSISGKVSISSCTIGELNLLGLIKPELQISINKVSVYQVLMTSVFNQGKLQLGFLNTINAYDIKFDKEHSLLKPFTDAELAKLKLHYNHSFFAMKGCSLTEAELNQIDFTAFQKVYCYQSRISDIKYSNIIWPHFIDSRFPPNSAEYILRFKRGFRPRKPDYLASRENYRQLKLAASNHHDYINEQYFHALEMESYDKTLSWTSEFWTKLILKLSYWTSNFGQSVIRPLLSLILINGFLFYLLYLTGDGPFNTFNFSESKNYVNTVAEFIRFANPLHKNEPDLTGWAFIIDVLIRICSSYFIYNLIRATRRFVR